MAQIQKGTTFATGMQVTAANLNALADSAILLPGAILEQPSGSTNPADLLLSTDGTVLKKVTASSMQTSGQIVIWRSGTAPTGWIPCDGRLAAPYPNLAAIYGTNIPNLTGQAPSGLMYIIKT